MKMHAFKLPLKMKLLYRLFLSVSFISVLSAMEMTNNKLIESGIHKLKRKKVKEQLIIPLPTFGNQQLSLHEYSRMIHAFKDVNFQVGYSPDHREYLVCIYPKDRPKVYRYDVYKKIITHACKRIAISKPRNLVPGDPAQLLFAHINFINHWNCNSPYTTNDIRYKQAVLDAFYQNEMEKLIALLNRNQPADRYR